MLHLFAFYFWLQDYSHTAFGAEFSRSQEISEQEQKATFSHFVNAPHFLIYNQKEDRMLMSKGIDKQVPIASLTKLMTALVVEKHYEMDDILIVPKKIGDIRGSQIYLEPADVIRVDNALHALLMSSANDIALTFALNFPGGYRAFVDEMNVVALELGMTNTHFTNPIGYDSKENYSTANDLLTLNKKVLKSFILSDIIQRTFFTFTSEKLKKKYTISNTNRLLYQNGLEVSGIKTGTTESAGQCIAVALTISDTPFIFVLLGSDNRYKDIYTMISYTQTYLRYITTLTHHKDKDENNI
jgi:D-alanyl-D-alanine carboxypeptidase